MWDTMKLQRREYSWSIITCGIFKGKVIVSFNIYLSSLMQYFWKEMFKMYCWKLLLSQRSPLNKVNTWVNSWRVSVEIRQSRENTVCKYRIINGFAYQSKEMFVQENGTSEIHKIPIVKILCGISKTLNFTRVQKRKKKKNSERFEAWDWYLEENHAEGWGLHGGHLNSPSKSQ